MSYSITILHNVYIWVHRYH